MFVWVFLGFIVIFIFIICLWIVEYFKGVREVIVICNVIYGVNNYSKYSGEIIF